MTTIAGVVKENNRKSHIGAEPRTTKRNRKGKLLPESRIRV